MNPLLFKGDCLEVMNQIPNHSVDMILCDLPYGTTACKWDVVIPFAPLWEQYHRIIKENGAIVLFGSEPFSSHLRMSNIKRFKYDWYWNKSRPSGCLNSKKQPMRKVEVVSVFYQKQASYYPQGLIEGVFNNDRPSRSKKIKGEYCHGQERNFGTSKYTGYPNNVLIFSNQNNKLSHPTQKPVPLLEYLIKTYTLEGETVLDNCMGSGSTGVACMNTNRKFIGIEKDDKYFEIAKKRIEENVSFKKNCPKCKTGTMTFVEKDGQ